MMKALLAGPGAATLLCAALLTLSGCQAERPARTAARDSASATPSQAAPSPEVHVLVDEAMLRKPHAILGGTVENVGGEWLENLSVEMELTRRSDGSTELRTATVQPAALGPGEKGRYSLKVLSGEWSNSRLVRLRAAGREQALAFKTSPGARRPPERLPDSRTIPAAKDSRPRSRSGGEEFINTPDTPISVP